MSDDMRTYWVGIKQGSDCPFQTLHIGGIDFPLYTEQVQKVPGESATQRTRIWGAMKQLTPRQVTELKDKMQKKVFRGHRLLDKGGRHYRANAVDRPISEYLYVKEVNPTDLIERHPIPPIPDEVVKSERLVAKAPDDTLRRKVAKSAKMMGTKVPRR